MRAGSPSLNPSGRPRGMKTVARQILEATADGSELVQWALKRWRDPSLDDAARERAHQWLSDRGLGRPVQQTELHAYVEAGSMTAEDDDALADQLSLDDLAELDRLDDEKRRVLERARIKALPDASVPDDDAVR